MACSFSAAVRLVVLGLFLYTGPASSVSESVNSGETVTLNCSAPYRINNIINVTVEWIKDGLGHVLVFEDGNVNPTKREQCFKDRVALADPELKNRNLSMILKNVMKNDEGLYECHFIDHTARSPTARSPTARNPTARKRRDASFNKPIQIIDLKVREQPGDVKEEEGSNERLRAGIIAGFMGFVVVVGVVVVVVCRFSVHSKSKKNEQQRSPGSIEGLLGPGSG